MSYASDRDRTVTQLEWSKAPWPAPPLNLQLTSGFRAGAYDLCWDDPGILPVNGRFAIQGVNVYRSLDSEFGPFTRVTDYPLGSTFWRDQTDNELVIEEDVTESFVLHGRETGSGVDAAKYVFRTSQYPIVKEGSQGVHADSPLDVQVFIDGMPARVARVHGFTGEVEIDRFVYADVAKQAYDPSPVPQAGSRVTCTYRYTRQLVPTNLMQRVFYRVTTVAVPIDCDLANVQRQDLVETPLENATSVTSYEVEKLDYMWREAVRRNRWILEQGGERVKLFLRKNAGVQCPCVGDDLHKQPLNACELCYGTGFFGGYEGPYDAIIAPDDAERRIAQKDIGRAVEHTYEVWTGPVPLLAQRDFLVKLNGVRYSVGAVRFPSNRGMVLQQHFSIGHIDEQDIRYSVPMCDPVKYAAAQFVPTGPEGAASSQRTEKENIPDERELRGRTVAWKNITY